MSQMVGVTQGRVAGCFGTCGQAAASCRARLARGFLLVSLVGAFWATGCASQPDQARDAGGAIVKTAGGDPVGLTLTVTPPAPESPELVHVAVEVVADPEATVHIEDYRSALSESDHKFEFRVASADRGQAEPTSDGRLRWVHTYVLEFILAGDYELPPAKVSYVALTADEDDKIAGEADTALTSTELATDPVEVSIAAESMSPVTGEALYTITRMDPPVLDAPTVYGRWWVVPVILAGLVVAGVVVYLLARRSGKGEQVVVIPAHDWAFEAIDSLLREDLIGAGRVQEFFYRISDVARGYVERRFGVAAPEMTTEEFLTQTSRDGRFDADTKSELTSFLSICDRVKYALHEPGRDICDEAVEATRRLVLRTRAHAGVTASPAQSGGQAA